MLSAPTHASRGARRGRAAAAAPARRRLRRARRDHRGAAALDRERERDLGAAAAAFDPLDHAAVLRARPAKLARARAVGAEDPHAQGDRQGDRPRRTRSAESWPAVPADDAHAALTAVHGIGPWTADIYLLFCLGHADAWPAGDLALQEAARLLFALPTRPNAKEMQPLAEAWRPWRGAAACMLWSYYRAAKQRERRPPCGRAQPARRP